MASSLGAPLAGQLTHNLGKVGGRAVIATGVARLVPTAMPSCFICTAGGGDWHMAYLLLYRAQRVPKLEA